MTQAPLTLNGHPVVAHVVHPNGYFTVMVHQGGKAYCVATWWPDLKTSWCWGHYHHDYNEAFEDFYETSINNQGRSSI